MADPLPLQTFLLSETTTAQYVKFELLSWWGHGGGLLFFEIQTQGEPHFFHCQDKRLSWAEQSSSKFCQTLQEKTAYVI